MKISEMDHSGKKIRTVSGLRSRNFDNCFDRRSYIFELFSWCFSRPATKISEKIFVFDRSFFKQKKQQKWFRSEFVQKLKYRRRHGSFDQGLESLSQIEE